MRVVCKNPECADSLGRHQDPPPLTVVGENTDAWMFKCRRCEKEGRTSFRVAMKTEVGGTVGAGLTERGYGTTVSKGPGRYRAGMTFSK